MTTPADPPKFPPIKGPTTEEAEAIVAAFARVLEPLRRQLAEFVEAVERLPLNLPIMPRPDGEEGPVCTCPDIDVSRWPGEVSFVKGRPDPGCGLHGRTVTP